MIETKTAMWATHNLADNWQVLNAVAKSNRPIITAESGNTATAPTLPHLTGTGFSSTVK